VENSNNSLNPVTTYLGKNSGIDKVIYHSYKQFLPLDGGG